MSGRTVVRAATETTRRSALRTAATAALLALAIALSALWTGAARAAPGTNAATVERGAYLAQVGNCAGCHTAPGGQDYAGGLRLDSDYGTFVTPNITPDAGSGIGDWSADEFYTALHEGQRPDGSPMYPACPYPSYTHVERADIDAIYAYLQQQAPVARSQPDHDLGWLYGQRSLVNIWQWLYFEPGALKPAGQRSADWQRGRYLVEGLGHCSGCHQARGRFGAPDESPDAAGAYIHGWYAPPLSDPAQAGLQKWSVEKAAAFLRAGKAGDAAMLGPMAQVVLDSLQYLNEDDARAMATYLTEWPERSVASPRRLIRMSENGRQNALAEGRTIYEQRCADCHGSDGQGEGPWPALAGNRGVTMGEPLNAANMIQQGGFPAATATNPAPYGMPPFHDLDGRDLAAVLSYIRGSWGNDAAPVNANDLGR